jgi:hypothetical protein
VGVAATSDASLLEVCNLGTGNVVVVVVEPLDDLEGPAALEHVATDEAPPQQRGFVSVPGLGKTDRAVLEGHVGAADQLMKGVEVTACGLDVLEGLGGLPDGIDGCLIAAGNIVVDHHRARFAFRAYPNMASSARAHLDTFARPADVGM